MTTHGARQVAARAAGPAASAGDPILASKITAPRVPEWAAPRPRITKLIAEGVRWCPLTVVTGPPGAGKTTAVAMWAAAGPGPVAWVCLDGRDNRPEVFWSYVVAALRRSGVPVPKALPAAARGRACDPVFLTRLAAALAGRDPPVTLVLDDLHLLTDLMVLDGLDYVLRNVGSGMRLAVCSRMDPLLPLHRYRVSGQLAEIRAGDLAFSTAEAGLLLARHGCTLPADVLESLMRRTEGWAAGLRLAALSLGSHPDPALFVKELAAEDSALTGYLVDEVLNAQPPQVRDVLLWTSILEQVSADAAVELTGDEQAAGNWQALARANAAAGHGDHARRVLAPVLAVGSRAPDRVRVQAWLADARLSHDSGDRARGRRSLASALRLAEPEQLRLPFAMERSWLGPLLRRDPDLAGIHRYLLAPALHRAQLPAPADTPDQAVISAVKALSEREQEVLRHVSGLLSYAEVASEMYITVNTVKTHVKNIHRKLATTRSSEAVRRARQLGLI